MLICAPYCVHYMSNLSIETIYVPVTTVLQGQSAAAAAVSPDEWLSLPFIHDIREHSRNCCQIKGRKLHFSELRIEKIVVFFTVNH